MREAKHYMKTSRESNILMASDRQRQQQMQNKNRKLFNYKKYTKSLYYCVFYFEWEKNCNLHYAEKLLFFVILF